MSELSALGASGWNVFARPEAFTEPEKVLEACFGSKTVGFAVFDTDLRYLAINRALAEMNGIPAPAHLGKTIREVLGIVADAVESRFQQVLLTGEPVLNCEISGVLPTRSEPGHWVGHYVPIPSSNGKVSRVGAIIVETTSLKVLERSLQDVDAQLRKEEERLQMLLDVSNILALSWNLQQVFPQDLGAHPPRPAPRIRRLRIARGQYRVADTPDRRLPAGEGVAYIPAHKLTGKS